MKDLSQPGWWIGMGREEMEKAMFSAPRHSQIAYPEGYFDSSTPDPEPPPVQRAPVYEPLGQEKIDELVAGYDRATKEALERDAWTRFAAGALACPSVDSIIEAAELADNMLVEWRARWGRKEEA